MLTPLVQLVTTKAANPRAQMQHSALQAAENYERQALDRLRRMGLAAADLELKGGKKSGLHGFQGDFLMEETLG
jgi:COP9 signalosome complex subunit 1